MDQAGDNSALGDFNEVGFDHYGVHSRFFRKDGKFFVETDGPDGKLATFEVKYTFGVDPLAYAERLARIAPDDPDLVALIDSLRRQRSSPAPTRRSNEAAKLRSADFNR